jgi:hypothetical protein
MICLETTLQEILLAAFEPIMGAADYEYHPCFSKFDFLSFQPDNPAHVSTFLELLILPPITKWSQSNVDRLRGALKQSLRGDETAISAFFDRLLAPFESPIAPSAVFSKLLRLIEPMNNQGAGDPSHQMMLFVRVKGERDGVS